MQRGSSMTMFRYFSHRVLVASGGGDCGPGIPFLTVDGHYPGDADLLPLQECQQGRVKGGLVLPTLLTLISDRDRYFHRMIEEMSGDPGSRGVILPSFVCSPYRGHGRVEGNRRDRVWYDAAECESATVIVCSFSFRYGHTSLFLTSKMHLIQSSGRIIRTLRAVTNTYLLNE
jgi:hypothetical protein